MPGARFPFVLCLGIALVPTRSELLLLLVALWHLRLEKPRELHVILVPHELLLGVWRRIEDVLLILDGWSILHLHLLDLLLLSRVHH